MYIKCSGLRRDLVNQHWAGIKFYNSSFVRKLYPHDNNALNESASTLQLVDILYAGMYSPCTSTECYHRSCSITIYYSATLHYVHVAYMM